MEKSFKIKKDLKEVNDSLNKWVEDGVGRQFMLVAVDTNNDILTNMKHFGLGSLHSDLIHIVTCCPHLAYDVYQASQNIMDHLNNYDSDFKERLEKCDGIEKQDLFTSTFKEYIEKLKADE